MLSISVALCSYNGERYIEAQLNSILQQTLKVDEIVICDDGSTDRTVEIIEQYAKAYPSVISFDKHLSTRLGSTKNFERAIELCQGEIVFLSDQDDVWTQNKVETVMDVFFKQSDVGLVFTNATLVDADLNPLKYDLWAGVQFDASMQREINQGRTVEALLIQNIVTGATMAFRKSVMAVALPIAPNWVHDGWITLLVACVSKIHFIDAPLILYRQHANNQIGVSKKTLHEKFIISREAQRNSWFLTVIDQFESVRNRINAAQIEASKKSQLLKLVDQKISHSKARVYKYPNMISRFFSLTSELLKGRYHRYSRGVISFIRDLVS